MRSVRSRGRFLGVDVNPAALRQARLRAGLSLAQLGGAELTRQAVHLFETGKARPSVQSLRLMADRLGVPETALLAHPNGDQHAFEDSRVQDLEDLCRRYEFGRAAERAEQLLGRSGHPRLRAFAHFYLGQSLSYLLRSDEALDHLRIARRLFDSLNDPWRAAEAMDWEAFVLHMLENVDALGVGQEALRRYRELEPRQAEVESRILEHIGTILAGRREFGSARACYDEAQRVSGGVRDLGRIARIDHGLALCYLNIGEWRLASDLLFKAVTLYEAEQRISGAPTSTHVPLAENDLGVVAMEQGDLDRAEEFLQAALEHFADAGVERRRSNVLLSLGDLRQRQGRLREAREFVWEAISLAQSLGEIRALAAGYAQLAELQAMEGESDLAEHSFQQALAVLRDPSLRELRANVQEAYRRVLTERHRQATARRSAEA